MDTKIRRRGRPLGTGTDDSAHLMAMARRMVADPTLNRAAVLREVVRSRKDWTATDDSVLHRLRAKWKAEGEDLLARARVEQVAQREGRERQERERHLREAPVLRDVAAAADGRVTGSSWPSVAASARMLGAVDSEMFKIIQRQMAESQTLWDNHRKIISAGLAAAKAQDQAIRAALAHSKYQDLEIHARIASLASLQQEVRLAAGTDLKRMSQIAGDARLDAMSVALPRHWRGLAGQG